ncbi:MAG: zinc ribbon-containing protein [Betaproteobacteria bacterium]
MRHPSSPGTNSTPRARTRGAIRTHLGRKRAGARGRGFASTGMADENGLASRRAQEDIFDRLMNQVQSLFNTAGERTIAALDGALDTAFNTVISAGEFTAENADRLRNFLKRDILHRDQPSLTFRTGDITTAGVMTCENCGWTIHTTRTSMLPACPQCSETTFRKSA